MTEPWLTVRRGEAPLILSFPHTGLELPSDCTASSQRTARHDADWYVDRFYIFAHDLGATTVHTALSRTVPNTAGRAILC
jgi:N-formylglutamate deformylase